MSLLFALTLCTFFFFIQSLTEGLRDKGVHSFQNSLRTLPPSEPQFCYIIEGVTLGTMRRPFMWKALCLNILFSWNLSPSVGSFPDAQLPSKRIIGPKNYEFLTSKREEFQEYLQVSAWLGTRSVHIYRINKQSCPSSTHTPEARTPLPRKLLQTDLSS